MSSEKKKLRTQQAMAGQHDELAVQNSIRRKYASNWPSIILQLTKRVQAVNNSWQNIIRQVMQIDGLRISYAREEGFDGMTVVVNVRRPKDGVDEVEIHQIKAKELMLAQQYLEVLIMDKLKNSKLIAKYAK